VTIEVARETALATFAARTDSWAVSMSCWPLGTSAVVEPVRPELVEPAELAALPAAANPPAAEAGAEEAEGAAAANVPEPDAALDELEPPEQPAAVAARMRITPGIPATPSRRRRPAKARVVRMPLGRRRRPGRLRREVTIRQRMPGCVRLDVCPTTFA